MSKINYKIKYPGNWFAGWVVLWVGLSITLMMVLDFQTILTDTFIWGVYTFVSFILLMIVSILFYISISNGELQ